MKSVNDANQEFYKNLYSKPGALEPYYTQAGLNTHTDLKLALEKQFLPEDKTVPLLVIGAGDGREVEFLQSQNYCNITALECDANAIEILRQKFGDSITIIHADIRTWLSESSFQLITWMWCGFSDFSREEQKFLLNKIMKMVSPGGAFLVDNAVDSSMMNVEASEKTTYHGQTISHFFETPEGDKYRGYVTKSPELHRWAKKSNVEKVDSVQYSTDTNRERKLYYLKKDQEISSQQEEPTIVEQISSTVSSFSRWTG